MNDILEESQAVKNAQQNTDDKRRLEFLAILVVLGATIAAIVKSANDKLIGQLSSLYDADGKLPAHSIGPARAYAGAVVHRAGVKLFEAIKEQVSPVGNLGADMAEADALARLDALGAAMAVLDNGARGVPELDYIQYLMLEATQNAQGAIARAVASGRTLQELGSEITASLTGTMARKAEQDAITQLSAALAKSFFSAAELNEAITGYSWNLSVRHRKNDECDFYANKVYAKDDPVLDLFPLHPGDLCWFSPVWATKP